MNKQKNSFLTLLFVISIVCVTSCGKEEGIRPPDHQQNTVPHGQLVAVLDSTTLSLDEFALAVSSSPMMTFAAGELGSEAMMVKNGLRSILTARQTILDAMFRKSLGRNRQGSRQWQLESYTFSYTSVTPTGEPVILSGRVTFPNNTVDSITHKLNSYTLYSHMFLYSNSWVPSQGFSLMSARALYNSAVIEPDEQGFGVDHGQHGIIYISSNVRARQLADCISAARKIMQRHGVVLSEDGYTTNWGNSFAAATALAYARYYDLYASKEEREAIRLKSTFVAHGPYIYDEVMMYKNSHPEYNGLLPTMAILSLDALNSNQLYGYTAEDFTPAWILTNTHIDPDGNEYNLFYAITHCVENFAFTYQGLYPNSELMSDIVATDMLTSNGVLDLKNKKTKAMLQAMKEQSVFDKWQPSTEIYMAHGEVDDMVPYSKTQEFFNTLCNQCGTTHLHWMDAKPLSKSMQQLQGTHVTMASEAMIWMMLSPEPKDMTFFYN